MNKEEILEGENKVCCLGCGGKYLTEEQKDTPWAITANRGVCCVCGQTKTVTSIRHFNNLQDQSQDKTIP